MICRISMYAAAASAAICLLQPNAAVAQVGQQQPRTGTAVAQESRQLLQQLEGNWNVDVVIFDMEAMGRDRQHGGRDTGRPGAATTEQLRSNIEQSLIRAGVLRSEAQREAQNIAMRIQQEQPDQQRIRQMLEQSMMQAGISQNEARQEAQRLAPQLQRMTRERRGLQPEDDDTASPITPRRDRPGMRPQGQFEAQGMARRNWILHENILQEEVSFSQVSPGMQPRQQEQWEQRPGTQPRQQQRGLGLGEGGVFEGQAMFGFDATHNMICHVWADSAKSELHYSLGRVDAAAREVTFYTVDADKVSRQLPHERRPGLQPGYREQQRPGTRGPAEEQFRQDRPGVRERRENQDRPGSRTRESVIAEHGGRVVLRIISDNEHRVTYYGATPTGRAERIMEITYTRWD